MAQNKDLVADAQTLLEENLSEKKSVESARRLDGCCCDHWNHLHHSYSRSKEFASRFTELTVILSLSGHHFKSTFWCFIS